MLRSVLPRPRMVLPRPRMVLPRPRMVLPRPRMVLPRARMVLPRARMVLPRPRMVLPRPRMVGVRPSLPREIWRWEVSVLIRWIARLTRRMRAHMDANVRGQVCHITTNDCRPSSHAMWVTSDFRPIVTPAHYQVLIVVGELGGCATRHRLFGFRASVITPSIRTCS